MSLKEKQRKDMIDLRRKISYSTLEKTKYLKQQQQYQNEIHSLISLSNIISL